MNLFHRQILQEIKAKCRSSLNMEATLVEKIWIHTEYHIAVVWCLITGKELENLICYQKKTGE